MLLISAVFSDTRNSPWSVATVLVIGYPTLEIGEERQRSGVQARATRVYKMCTGAISTVQVRESGRSRTEIPKAFGSHGDGQQSDPSFPLEAQNVRLSLTPPRALLARQLARSPVGQGQRYNMMHDAGGP